MENEDKESWITFTTYQKVQRVLACGFSDKPWECREIERKLVQLSYWKSERTEIRDTPRRIKFLERTKTRTAGVGIMKNIKAKAIKNLNLNDRGMYRLQLFGFGNNNKPKRTWSVGSISPPRRETKYEDKRNCSY